MSGIMCFVLESMHLDHCSFASHAQHLHPIQLFFVAIDIDHSSGSQRKRLFDIFLDFMKLGITKEIPAFSGW